LDGHVKEDRRFEIRPISRHFLNGFQLFIGGVVLGLQSWIDM